MPPPVAEGVAVAGALPLEPELLAAPAEEVPPLWEEAVWGAAPPAEPCAEMRAPTSTLREVITPSKGEVTRS